MSESRAGIYLVCRGQNVVFQSGDQVTFDPAKRLMSISRQGELVCFPDGETQLFLDWCERDFEEWMNTLAGQYDLEVLELERCGDVDVALLN